MPLMSPIINLNGATKESHIEARLNAKEKVYTAMMALQEMRPHGRDYLGDTEKYNADLVIYSNRFNMLLILYNDLEAEALAIQES